MGFKKLYRPYRESVGGGADRGRQRRTDRQRGKGEASCARSELRIQS